LVYEFPDALLTTKYYSQSMRVMIPHHHFTFATTQTISPRSPPDIPKENRFSTSPFLSFVLYRLIAFCATMKEILEGVARRVRG